MLNILPGVSKLALSCEKRKTAITNKFGAMNDDFNKTTKMKFLALFASAAMAKNIGQAQAEKKTKRNPKNIRNQTQFTVLLTFKNYSWFS